MLTYDLRYTEKDWNPTTWEKGASATGQHMAVTSYCKSNSFQVFKIYTSKSKMRSQLNGPQVPARLLLRSLLGTS